MDARNHISTPNFYIFNEQNVYLWNLLMCMIYDSGFTHEERTAMKWKSSIYFVVASENSTQVKPKGSLHITPSHFHASPYPKVIISLLLPVFPSSSSSRGFPTKSAHAFFISPFRATCPYYANLLRVHYPNRIGRRVKITSVPVMQ